MKGPSLKRSRDLVNFNRRDLRVAIGMLTGTSCLKSFLHKIGKAADDRCRWCEDGKENIMHFLIGCKDLFIMNKRKEIYGKDILSQSDLE